VSIAATGFAAGAMSPARGDSAEQKRGTGDQHGRMGEWAYLSPSRVQVEGTGPSSRPLLGRDSRPEPRALHGVTVLKSFTGDQQAASRNSFLFQQWKQRITFSYEQVAIRIRCSHIHKHIE
jgi:hypothetical protein